MSDSKVTSCKKPRESNQGKHLALICTPRPDVELVSRLQQEIFPVFGYLGA